MEIDIANRTDHPVDLDRWSRVVTEYMNEMALADDSGVSISFVGDAEIRQLNKQYRDLDEPTDVLSFSLEEGAEIPAGEYLPRYLGDIVLSVDTLTRQAVAANHSLERETAVLLAHGLLHLLGYDHAEPDETKVMFAHQEVLAGLAPGIA